MVRALSRVEYPFLTASQRIYPGVILRFASNVLSPCKQRGYPLCPSCVEGAAQPCPSNPYHPAVPLATLPNQTARPCRTGNSHGVDFSLRNFVNH